eukprot:snap_masked-scaffold_5-processed-gene-14.33-mRNA-1 protein AED:1.00 eAED:1.00 QI:0/0/0/0/1/1/2/0/66
MYMKLDYQLFVKISYPTAESSYVPKVKLEFYIGKTPISLGICVNKELYYELILINLSCIILKSAIY